MRELIYWLILGKNRRQHLCERIRSRSVDRCAENRRRNRKVHERTKRSS
jgi:hypothetical protein